MSFSGLDSHHFNQSGIAVYSNTPVQERVVVSPVHRWVIRLLAGAFVVHGRSILPVYGRAAYPTTPLRGARGGLHWICKVYVVQAEDVGDIVHRN